MAVPDSTSDEGETLYERALDVLMTGVAIIVPIVVTIYLIKTGIDFVVDALQPFIDLLQWAGIIQQLERVELIVLLIELGIYSDVISFLTEIIALTILFGGIILIGIVGRNQYGERVIDFFDMLIATIPGIGTVYKSFRRMGDVMLDESSENFQDVKLVQCLEDDMYAIGFKTADSPATVEESTGHDDMVTMFIPMAPNPVTGGFLTHVPREKVYDVDMTIEEGVRSIITSGIASGEGPHQKTQLTMGDLNRVADFQELQDAIQTEVQAQREDDDRSK